MNRTTMCRIGYNYSTDTLDDPMDPRHWAPCMVAMARVHYNFYAPLTPGAVSFFSVAYALITIFGLAGNGLVMFAVLRNRRMRTSRNVYITNLAASNFLLAIIMYPFLWVPSEAYLFPYGRVMCKLVNAFPASNVYCSTLTITVMSVDRYYAARSTQSRSIYAQRKRSLTALLVAAMIWALSLGLVAPLVAFYDTMQTPQGWDAVLLEDNSTGDFSWPLCVLAPGMEQRNPGGKWAITLGISLTQIAFLYLIPLSVLLFFNARLVRFLWVNTLGKVVHRLQGPAPSSSGGAASTSVCAGLDRASAHSQRRRNRTAVLLLLMAATYALAWLPYTVFTLLEDLRLWEPDQLSLNLSKLISMLSICVNPVLYGYLNTNFKREFADIFRCFPPCGKFVRELGPQRGAVSETGVCSETAGGSTNFAAALISRVNVALKRPRNTSAATATTAPSCPLVHSASSLRVGRKAVTLSPSLGFGPGTRAPLTESRL